MASDQTTEQRWRIRQIYCPPGPLSIFATGFFSERVTVWSLSERNRLGELTTCLDFGGYRLLVIPTDPILVVTASYYVHGIRCYDLSGKLVWHKDLRKAAGLVWLGGNRVAVLRNGPIEIIDSNTGASIARVRGAHRIRLCGDFLIGTIAGKTYVLDPIDYSKQRVLVSGEPDIVAIGPGQVGATWLQWRDGLCQGCSLIVAGDSGEERFRYSCPSGFWINELAWNPIHAVWIAVERTARTTVIEKLLTISDRGDVRVIGELPDTVENKLSGDGDHLVSAAGNVLRTSDLSVVWQFEPRQYVTVERLAAKKLGDPIVRYLDP